MLCKFLRLKNGWCDENIDYNIRYNIWYHTHTPTTHIVTCAHVLVQQINTYEINDRDISKLMNNNDALYEVQESFNMHILYTWNIFLCNLIWSHKLVT